MFEDIFVSEDVLFFGAEGLPAAREHTLEEATSKANSYSLQMRECNS